MTQEQLKEQFKLLPNYYKIYQTNYTKIVMFTNQTV